MERIIFKEQDPKSKGPKTAVVRVSRVNYDKVMEISEKAGLSANAVADRMLSFALEHVEWEK